ncbi:MAG: ribonuclease [Bacteroidales bacterium]|nr:ribonuclease [Bacteroidales bacterium]
MLINRLTRTLFFSMAVSLTAISASAEIPSGYYSNANGKKGAELKTALSNLIYNHTEVSSYSALPQYFQRTDVYPESNRWWDMYSDIPLYAPSFKGLNREHSFPKSWWGGSTTTPAYVDLNHLYPSEAAANMAKSNYPLGTVSTSKFDNGVVKVGYAVTGQGGGAAQVFEPADEYKGDFARTYFYMVTCYQNLTWNKSYSWMLQQNTYPTLTGWAQQLLLEWNRMDPVSEKEINRNEEVYKIQNNRNPFIDYPQLAEYIWGDRRDELFYEDTAADIPTGEPTLITPVQDMSLDFNEVAVGSATSSRLFFNGENLRGNLSVTVYGADKAMFAVSAKSIPTSVVNSSAGYWLTITYTPASEGMHSARLIVSDGGLTGSLGVALLGQGCPVPELTAFEALPPAEVTRDSYIARWEAPDQVVDYYIVTRTRYYSGSTSSEELLAEDNEVLISDYDASVPESYNVRSVRLGFESPRSNEIYVDYAAIDEVFGDILLGTAPVEGGIRFVCPVPVADAVIYDMQGRPVRAFQLITDDMYLTDMMPGVYLLTSPALRRPVRIVIK